MTSVVRNARTDYHLDTRIRRRHVPLYSQQRRLRHLKCLVARNLTPIFPEDSFPTGVYFTLHLNPSLPAFYTSETSEDCVNPAWRMFEATAFPEEINTSGGCVCGKIWFCFEAKAALCVLEHYVFFSGLVFLGEQIPKEGKKFSPNSILFGTPEGFYGSPDCLQVSSEEIEFSVSESMPADPCAVRVSYSVNTVYRIQTVQRAIKQTQAAVRRSRALIQEQLLLQSSVQERLSRKEMLLMKLSILRSEVSAHLSNIKQLEKRKGELELNLKCIDEDKSLRREELARDGAAVLERRHSYNESCEMLLKTSAQLNLRRKQLVSELSVIYPISMFTEKNGYSICGVYLPQSEEFTGHDDTMISVALGYVTHLVMMISNFLNVPLRYPLNHFGSRSSVYDLVLDKIPDKEREFPLYARGKDKMHFYYGVYLLNKDIAQLRQYCALTTTDLRLTLANLHDLIKQRLSIKSDLQHSYIYSPSQQLQVQIKSDPSQVFLTQNGSNKSSLHFEISTGGTNSNKQNMVPNPAEIMTNLEREMATMTSTPVHHQQGIIFSPKALSLIERSGAMSCSLDKGLNEIRMMQMSMSSDENRVAAGQSIKSKGIRSASSVQHGSVPNLSVISDSIMSIKLLKEKEAVFSPPVCTVGSAHESEEDLRECPT